MHSQVRNSHLPEHATVPSMSTTGKPYVLHESHRGYESDLWLGAYQV